MIDWEPFSRLIINILTMNVKETMIRFHSYSNNNIIVTKAKGIYKEKKKGWKAKDKGF